VEDISRFRGKRVLLNLEEAEKTGDKTRPLNFIEKGETKEPLLPRPLRRQWPEKGAEKRFGERNDRRPGTEKKICAPLK